MKFSRLMVAAAIVALVGVGGMFALAPETHGQVKRKIVTQDPLNVVTWSGGGSRVGIEVRDVEASDVTKHKLSGQTGAVIEEVASETPAAKAGLKAGDVVVNFDGERVRSARQLDRLVEETPAGRSVKVSVMRDGSRLDLDVTPEASSHANVWPKRLDDRLGALKHDEALNDALEKLRERQLEGPRVPAFEFDWHGDLLGTKMRGRLGVSAESVSDQLAQYFGVESGVLVRHVDEDSPAAKAGVKAGDVITAVNGTPVRDADDLRREVNEVEEGKAVALSVTRDKKTLSLNATIDRPEQARPRVRRIV
jgi:serine protease Do